MFKQVVKKNLFREETHKLDLVINELKGDNGKLQYKEPVKYSKLDEKEFYKFWGIKIMVLVLLISRLFLTKLIVWENSLFRMIVL